MSFMHRGLVDVFQHAEYDDFWRGFDPGERYEEFEIPVFYECGWYDRYTGSSFVHFNGVRAKARSEHARGEPEDPGRAVGARRQPGAAERRPCASARSPAPHRLALQVRWFDRWLKGIENGIDEEPPIAVYVCGADAWLEAEQWPPPGVQERTLYLAAGERRGERVAERRRAGRRRALGAGPGRLRARPVRPGPDHRRARRRHLDVAVRAARPARRRGPLA